MFRLCLNKSSAALASALAISLLATPAAAEELADDPQAQSVPLALMGTIPIYWGEAFGGFEAQVAGRVHRHWARAQLEEHFALWPLDYLSPERLADFDLLLMAQPRGLTPEENVALDAWVRAGGRLLLFADPVMTGHTHYALGDRRRPQDTALLSPILAHWGLELLFDADQPVGVQMRENVGSSDTQEIPVNLAGHFQLLESQAHCRLNPAEILAICGIGEGRAVLLADAALLDSGGQIAGAPKAFAQLCEMAFGPMRELAGRAPVAASIAAETSENKEENVSRLAQEWPSPSAPEPPPDP